MSNLDFSQPQRQSYIAIITILGKTIWSVTRQILPAVAVIFIGGAKNKTDQIIYFVIGAALLTCVYSIINFFKTYYYIDEDELILETGIIGRKRISIPFTKIQTIDSEQSLIHRLFGVTKVKVDTAGGDKTEFELAAIDLDIAQGLRDLLIHKKEESTIAIQNDNSENQERAQTGLAEQKEIMHIDTGELWRIGITSNHLRSSWLIIAFGAWIFNMLDDMGLDFQESYEDVDSSIFNFNSIMMLTMIIVIISIMISLVGAVVRHYDLRFFRTSRGFKMVAGLLTKKEVSAQDHKIQYIEWSQNLLQRSIGISEMTLHQASSDALKSKQKIMIPGMNRDQIDLVTSTLFDRKDIEKLPQKSIDYSYFTRFSTIIVVLSIVLSSIAYFFISYKSIVFISLFGIWMIITRFVRFRKSGYGYDDDHIWIKGGFIDGKYALLPTYKIQAIKLLQSPFQRRNSLCNINFVTAAGQIGVAYIPYTEGKYMLDRYIYEVELNSKTWM